jgi:hypothetical protein
MKRQHTSSRCFHVAGRQRRRRACRGAGRRRRKRRGSIVDLAHDVAPAPGRRRRPPLPRPPGSERGPPPPGSSVWAYLGHCAAKRPGCYGQVRLDGLPSTSRCCGPFRLGRARQGDDRCAATGAVPASLAAHQPTYKNGWRDFDYVVLRELTPSILRDLPMVAAAIRHSEVLAGFGNGEVTVRRVIRNAPE